MSFRPSSAPTRQAKAGGSTAGSVASALSKHRDRSPAGTRVQFHEGAALVETSPEFSRTLPRAPLAREPRPIPEDPIPDSDDEPTEETPILTPRSAERLELLKQRQVDPKWWHIPDGRIEELVLSASEDAQAAASSSSSHKLAKTISCPSSMCRGMVNAGTPKKPSPLAGTWPMDGCHSSSKSQETDTGWHMSALLRSPNSVASGADSLRSSAPGPAALQHCSSSVDSGALAASSTFLRDIQTKDAIAKGMAWQLEGRTAFDHITGTGPLSTTLKRGWTEADALLSWPHPGKSPHGSMLSDAMERPSTAPEPKVGCLPGVTGPSAKALAAKARRRPTSGTAGGEAKPKSRAAMARVSISKLGRFATISSTHSGHKHNGIADSEQLIQVDLVFYDNSDRIGVLIHPEARIGPDPKVDEPEKSHLKGMISCLTGIPSDRQRLLCRNCDVSADMRTLRSVGISHGNTVMVCEKKDSTHADRDTVVLACTAKKLEKQQKKGTLDSKRKAFSRKCEREQKGDKPVMMPRWGWEIPPDNTKAGIGYNGFGAASSFKFENNHIWYDMSPDSPQVDSRLTQIRQNQAYTTPIEMSSPGNAPHCQ